MATRFAALKALLALLAWVLASAAAQAGVVAAQLAQHLATQAATDEVAVIVQLVEREDLAAFRDPKRSERLKRLLTALRARAARTQAPVAALARGLGARDLRQLWTINALALKLPAARIQATGEPPGRAVGSPRQPDAGAGLDRRGTCTAGMEPGCRQVARAVGAGLDRQRRDRRQPGYRGRRAAP